MSIHVPTVVYRGTINGAHDRGDRVITVTNVSGNLADAIAGNTVLFGTTSGGDDVARRRFRSRSGQDITIDENSNVWASGQHVTILRDWEIWPIFPFIELESPYTFYKDRDKVYGEENFKPYPVPVMKDDQAGYLVAGSCVFPLNGTGSYAVADGATISSYSWSSTGGVIAAPTASSTTITFTTAGSYWVYLTVTDSNGKSYTTRRIYYVHERTGANAPFLDFIVEAPPTRSWRNGGSTVRIRVNANAGITNIPDRASILLWNEAFYNGDEEYIGDAGNVIFSGNIRSESLVVDQNGGFISFEATSVSELLKRHQMFSVSLTDDPSPDTWWKYFKLTLPRAIHHLWSEHSTLFIRRDVILPIADTRRVPAVDDFVEGDLYSLVESFALQHGVYAHVCCSADNRVYVEEDVNILGQTARDAKPTITEITKADRMGDVDVTLIRQQELDTSFVFLGGVSYDGSETTPHISKAPGEVPETEGSGAINLERQIVANQDEANERSGRALAIANAKIKDIRLKHAGNYSFMDVVPQAWYTINVAANENKRGITLTNQKIVPRNIVLEYDSGAGTLFTSTTWDIEATGHDGITGNFPTEIPPPGPTPPAPSQIGNLVLFNSTIGCYVHGSWLQRNGGLTGTNIQDRHGGADPWWYTALKQNTFNPAFAILWKGDVGKIYRSADCGVTWVAKTPSNNPPNTFGDSPSPTAGGVTYIQYEGNFYAQDQHVFLAVWQNGSGKWRSWVVLTEDDGDTWSWVSLGADLGGSSWSSPTKYAEPGSFIGTGDRAQRVLYLTSSKFVLAYKDDSDGQGYVRIGNNDGTLGTPKHLDGGDNDIAEFSLARIDDDEFIVAYANGTTGGGSRVHTVRIGTVSGNTITLNTANDYYTGTVGTADSQAHGDVIIMMSSDTAVLAHSRAVSGTGGSYAYKITIVGTTISAVSSAVSFVGSGTTVPLSLIKIDSTHFVIGYTTSGTYICGEVTISSVQFPSSSVTLGVASVNSHTIAPLAVSNKFLVLYRTSGSAIGSKIGTISGTTVTLGADNASLVTSAPVPMNARLLGDGNVALFHQYGGNVRITVFDADTGGDSVTVSTFHDSGVAVSFAVGGNGDVGQDGQVMVVAFVDSSGTDLSFMTLAGVDQIKSLGMSISKGSGGYLYVSAWVPDELIVLIYELPSLTQLDVLSFGAATEAEMEADTYTAKPCASRINDNVCYLYGRLNNPASLGLCHIVRTVNAFSNLSVVESGWGGDHCSAFVEGPLYDLNAVRKRGVGSYFYRGNASEGLFYKSQLPFGVNSGALAATIDKYVIVGGSSPAGSQMVMQTTFPFTVWTDITEDYPLSGSVTGLTLV
jgi:hypothetical protein